MTLQKWNSRIRAIAVAWNRNILDRCCLDFVSIIFCVCGCLCVYSAAVVGNICSEAENATRMYKMLHRNKFLIFKFSLSAYFFYLARPPPSPPQLATASSFATFLDHTQRRTIVGRTPLDEWSARWRDLYLLTHNTHKRQTSLAPVGFGPTTSAGDR